MKKLVAFIIILGASLGLKAQTTLSAGDLVFIHYNSIGSISGTIAFISRVPISSGTSINVTNRQWVSSGQNTSFQSTQSDQGTISILFNEDVAIGQVISVTFQVNTSSPTVSSTVGTATFSGNKFDFGQKTGSNNLGQIWVYQGTDSSPAFIAGLSWKGTPNPVPSGLVFTSGSTQNSFDLNINGSSDKCGCWTQYSDPTNNTTASSTVNFSSTLNNSFYNRSTWIFATSNSTNATLGINPCSPSQVFNFIESSLVFAKYRFGKTLNQWDAYSYSTNSWTANVTAPNWTSDTRDKEVILYQNVELGTFNAASPASTTYECSALTLVDSVNNNVTLTLTAGNILRPYYGVTMTDKNSGTAGSPSILLKSAPDNAGKVHYAQVAPTAAPLNGTYTYDLYISKAGWHHLTSPIQSTLQGVNPVTQGAASLFAFDYTGATTGFPNVFHWIGDDNTGTFWDTVRGNYNFHDRSYAINFAANQVPVVLRVSGAARVSDQDAQSQENALFGTGSSSSPGWGAPGWTTGITYNGWNFYGNPYMSFISTRKNKTYHGTAQSDLSSSVYVWQPMRNNLSNGQNYYTHNGSTGDQQAILIPPFQAFFMQNTGTATGSNGFIRSKKMRVALGSTDSSISRKASGLNEEYALSLLPPGMNDPERIYLDQAAEMNTWGKSVKHDSPYSGNANEVFAILYDSTLYKIKRTPLLLEDSVRVPVVVSFKGHGGLFTMNNHYLGSSYTSFIVDHKTGQRTDLTNQSYSFVNDTIYPSVRFTWVLSKNSVGIDDSPSNHGFTFRQSSSAIQFLGTMENQIHSIDIYSINGLHLHSQTGIVQQEVTVSTAALPPGVYLAKINQSATIKFSVVR